MRYQTLPPKIFTESLAYKKATAIPDNIRNDGGFNSSSVP